MNNPDLIVEFIKEIYQTNEHVALHEPTFSRRDKAYVEDAIDSTFVSSVGRYVDDFEREIEIFTGTPKAVSVVNGTAALNLALKMVGVEYGDLVITQALTFVATCNAIYHMGATPVFVDVSKKTLGLCPKATQNWLEEHAVLDDQGQCRDRVSGTPIKAVVCMHTFGHPVEIDELMAVCENWNLAFVEDAAESLGSYYKDKHTGTFGDFGTFSFNGNKIITTGGGGMLLCRDPIQGVRAKHLSTTAKIPHPYEFHHDEAGFNYRMPNLNAALGCAQMTALDDFITRKRSLARAYEVFFENTEYTFVKEPEFARSNYWLNAVICPDKDARDAMLKQCNAKGVMCRPVWQLMHRMPNLKNSPRGDLSVSEWGEAHLVNIPSTPPRTPL